MNKTVSDAISQKGLIPQGLITDRDIFHVDKMNESGMSIYAPSIRLLDMGCGKGYLTMAAYHFLCNHYHDRFNVQALGIDVREKLINEASKISSEILGYEETSLQFQAIAIEEYLSQNTVKHQNNDMVNYKK